MLDRHAKHRDFWMLGLEGRERVAIAVRPRLALGDHARSVPGPSYGHRVLNGAQAPHLSITCQALQADPALSPCVYRSSAGSSLRLPPPFDAPGDATVDFGFFSSAMAQIRGTAGYNLGHQNPFGGPGRADATSDPSPLDAIREQTSKIEDWLDTISDPVKPYVS